MSDNEQEPTLISFFVEGEPRPKQSFRVSGRNGGFTHPRVKAWQTDVACEAERSMRSIGRFNQPFSAGYLAVRLIFFLGNHRRVDLDNLSKAVLDGLNGICYDDDRQIVDLNLRKVVVTDKKQKPGVNVFVCAYLKKEG
ncbi:MAG TPA: hypothetical protein DCS05_04385 [Nitrospiraceae bacterium]|nr:hypothetical protein [Nitrospiraceae bacterium]